VEGGGGGGGFGARCILYEDPLLGGGTEGSAKEKKDHLKKPEKLIKLGVFLTGIITCSEGNAVTREKRKGK